MVDWAYGGGPIVVNSFDPAYLDASDFGRWSLVGPTLPDVWDRLSAGTAVLMSSNFGLHLGARVGDEIILDTPSGPLKVQIGGVLMTLVSPRGAIVMSRDLYKQHWRDFHIVHALIRLRPGAQIVTVRGAIAQRFGKEYGLKILSLPELGQWFGEQVQKAFAGVYALGALILLVVLFGTADTLGAGVLERRRELAQLRATGVRARDLRRIVLFEAALLGVLGLTLAMAIGLTLGVFWVHATFPYMLGWVLQLHIPWAQLTAIAVLGIATCLVAAWVPAQRASSLRPALGLRYE